MTYGLNVCVLPKFIGWNLKLTVMGTEDRAFERPLGGGALTCEMSVLIKEGQESSLALSTTWGHKEKSAFCNAPEPDHASTLILVCSLQDTVYNPLSLVFCYSRLNELRHCAILSQPLTLQRGGRRVKWAPIFAVYHSIKPGPVNPSARLACVAPGSRPTPRNPGTRSQRLRIQDHQYELRLQANLHGSRLHACSCGLWCQASPSRVKTRPIPTPNWPEDSGSKTAPVAGWVPQTQVPGPSLQTPWTPASGHLCRPSIHFYTCGPVSRPTSEYSGPRNTLETQSPSLAPWTPELDHLHRPRTQAPHLWDQAHLGALGLQVHPCRPWHQAGPNGSGAKPTCQWPGKIPALWGLQEQASL